MTKTNTATGGKMEIANTILKQMGGAGRIMAMTGVKQFVALDDGVQFRFKGSKVANICKIVLDPSDTYTVEFHKARGVNCKLVKSFPGAYCDMLKELFESTTGLYLSF